MIKHLLQKHNRITLIVLFCYAFSLATKAQNLFNKTYIEDRPVLLFGSVMCDDNYYYVTGVSSDYTNLSRTFVAKIDELGNIIKYKSVYDSLIKNYASFDNAFIKNMEGDFVLTGYSGDSLARMLMIKFDSSLSSLQVYEYYTPNTLVFGGRAILQYYDSSYFITGVRTDSLQNNVNIFLMKIDKYGNRLWEKYYNSEILDYAKSIIKLSNGRIMLGAFRSDGGDIHEHANTWLIEVDTGGNIKRQWFDPSDSTYAAEGLKQTSDGGFMYGAQKKHSQPFSDVYCIATIVKMNNNFQKQWTYTGGTKSTYTGINDIEELPDGNFIACGQYPVYGTDTALWGCVIKLNSAGQVLWEKTYRGINANRTFNFLSDIDVLSDGSFIAVGQCKLLGHTPPQVGWFLKLDSNGCEIDNCLVGIDEPAVPAGAEELQFSIYPNPFTSGISISIKAPFAGLGSATFTITNLVGQTIYRKEENNLAAGYTKMLDLSMLANGVYFVSVSTGEGMVTKKVVKQ